MAQTYDAIRPIQEHTMTTEEREIVRRALRNLKRAEEELQYQQYIEAVMQREGWPSPNSYTQDDL